MGGLGLRFVELDIAVRVWVAWKKRHGRMQMEGSTECREGLVGEGKSLD